LFPSSRASSIISKIFSITSSISIVILSSPDNFDRYK